MKRLKPALLLGTASALLVVAFVIWDSGVSTSPGSLSAVHARSAGIDEHDCRVCHGDAGTTMAAACAACHETVARQIESRSGFHGTLDFDAARCGTCHEEHHGADMQLAGESSFALAGVPDRDAFAHEKLAFALEGVHLRLDCKRCHAHADDLVLEKGCPRFGGLEQGCASCHDDPHTGKLADCAACHGQEEPFAKVARFTHPDSFALTGAHAEPGCLDCHPKEGRWSVEASGVAGGTARATRTARTCAECHESPHQQRFLTLVAAEVAAQAGAECAACHPVAGDSFDAADETHTEDLHALAGFALEPPHADATCEQCHAPGPKLAAPPAGADATAAFHALHPGRAADDCKACHVDPHAGQFENGAFAGQSCRACHAELAFTPPEFGIAQHARTSFPLTRSHEAVACSACHARAHAGEPRTFHGTSQACASCHVDAHAGAFAVAGGTSTGAATGARPPANVGDLPAGGCERCHTTNTFSRIEGSFDHAWTGFALRGEHASLDCAKCHSTRAVPDAAGRAFGRVSEAFKGPPQACSTCHADVHRGAFELPSAAGSQADSCARCHTEAGFHGARAGFDHAAATAFALTGAHARTDCESCHVPRAKPDAHGRTFGFVAEAFPGPTDDCRTCHVDPHGDAFERVGGPAVVAGKSGCVRCHTTDSFDAAAETFDHQSWTGFALAGAHARVDCTSCHVPSSTAATGTFSRARGTACQDCHADPHVGQFARDGRTDCSSCHTSATTFRSLTFDHQRDARFALDERHAKLDCSSCHVSTPVAGTGLHAVRYKPLGTQCADCHDPRSLR